MSLCAEFLENVKEERRDRPAFEIPLDSEGEVNRTLLLVQNPL